MDRLTDVEEYLDGPLQDRAALQANLRDLARINRFTGGAGLSVRAVRDLLPNGGTVVDVGTGGVDIPVRLLADARRRNVPLEVTATDSRQEVLDAAQVVRPSLATIAGLHLTLADGRRLTYPDDAFDVAHASMVVHHLDETDAVAFIAELGRVAGLDETGSLAIYGPLIEQTLGNARSLGIRAALTGPITRGDRGTLAAHLAALREHAPAVLDLYTAAAEREIALAEGRGALTPEAAQGLRSLLATAV